MADQGRSTEYTDKVADIICLQIADGISLKTICEGELDSDGETRKPVADCIPCRATVYNWLHDNKDFMDKYTRARKEQADLFAQEIVDISDGTGDVQRDRLRVEARKWVASKLKGSLYGDKQYIDHTTAGKEIKPAQQASTEQLEALIASHIKK